MIVGIDLGTTNTTLALASSDQGSILDVPVAQLVSAGNLEVRPALPSFLLLPSAHQYSLDSLSLPWDEIADSVAGTMARDEGSKVPDRLISSAKSWMSQEMLDPRTAILPWKAPEEVQKLSPIDVSARYLKHICSSYRYLRANPRFANALPPELLSETAGDLEEQTVYLTVPASFDALARELTVEAARKAGLEHLILLEEPQAAFYAWLQAHSEDWRQLVHLGDQILVCDVGGGTCDFSLIDVQDHDGQLGLERVAVGHHLLLGGDNMDLALAVLCQQKLKTQGHKIDSWQFQALVHAVRSAKERLLVPGGLDLCNVSIPGRGTGMMAGSLSSELKRSEVEAVLCQGFFPEVSWGQVEKRERRLGLSEVGLSFESDPAITKHLARFLESSTDKLPTRVLFNGGVFRSPVLRQRLLDIICSWNPHNKVQELRGADLDRAVCRGAVYYGQARSGQGLRIRGGTTKAYYLSVEIPRPAIPGMAPPTKAVCVAPIGMEEGTVQPISDLKFHLAVGDDLEFPFLTSASRHQDQLADSLEDWEDESDIEPLTTVKAHIKGQQGARGWIPVQLESHLTEVGTLELWCKEQGGQQGSWKLEFGVREHAEKP